ncbi:polyketide synthase, partial [Streptomyces sp. NPDC057638]
MDPMLADFRDIAETLTYHPPTIPVVSDVTGEPATAELLGSAAYWVRHVREAVRFADVVGSLEAAGVTTFVELGPDAVLSGMGQSAVENDEIVFAPVLRRDRSESHELVSALALVHARGAATVDWRAFFAPRSPSRADLPTYAFQREHYWLESVGRRPESGVPRGADGWRYRVEWRPLAEPASSPALSGTWLLVVPDGNAGDTTVAAVRAALTGQGAHVLDAVVPAAQGDRDLYAEKLSSAVGSVGGLAGVLSLVGLAGGGVGSAVALVQALGDVGVGAPVWLATCGAVSVGGVDGLVSVVQAQLWGLGVTAGLELPERWGGVVDLPEVVDERAGVRLCGVLAGVGGEDQV